MIFQIVLITFAAFAVIKTWRQFRSRAISRYWFLVLVLFWVAVAVVTIAPQTTNIIADTVGIGRGADLVVYVGMVVLFYIVHRLLLNQQKLSEELTEMVRQSAIEKAGSPAETHLNR